MGAGHVRGGQAGPGHRHRPAGCWGSAGAATDGSKGQLADTVHQLISAMGLTGVTLVGHDIGGMAGYAYLRAHQDLARAVILAGRRGRRSAFTASGRGEPAAV